MANGLRIIDGIRRGLGLRCPTCGVGRLFAHYLKVSPQCEVCGADNTVYPSDDAPPYLTAVVIGHVFLPVILWVDRAWEPALWLEFSIALPLFVLVTMVTLPFVKGAVIGHACATGITYAAVGPEHPAAAPAGSPPALVS